MWLILPRGKRKVYGPRNHSNLCERWCRCCLVESSVEPTGRYGGGELPLQAAGRHTINQEVGYNPTDFAVSRACCLHPSFCSLVNRSKINQSGVPQCSCST